MSLYLTHVTDLKLEYELGLVHPFQFKQVLESIISHIQDLTEPIISCDNCDAWFRREDEDATFYRHPTEDPDVTTAAFCPACTVRAQTA